MTTLIRCTGFVTWLCHRPWPFRPPEPVAASCRASACSASHCCRQRIRPPRPRPTSAPTRRRASHPASAWRIGTAQPGCGPSPPPAPARWPPALTRPRSGGPANGVHVGQQQLLSGVTSQCDDERRRPGDRRRHLRRHRQGRPLRSGAHRTPSVAMASSNRRTNRAAPATRASSATHAGHGRPGTSPSTKLSTSRPRSSVPSHRGHPGNPTAARCSSTWCKSAECRPLGRRTVPATRTTPSVASPPSSGISGPSLNSAAVPVFTRVRRWPAPGTAP